MIIFQCKKLEVLGEETLIFCSGSDGVITSNLAALFFKPVDTVFSKFKEFCSSKYEFVLSFTVTLEFATIHVQSSSCHSYYGVSITGKYMYVVCAVGNSTY